MAGADVPTISLPRKCAALWEDFWELSAFRDDGCRIKPSEIESYARLTGRRWCAWEMKALMAMDRIVVLTSAEEERFTRERRDHEQDMARKLPKGVIG